MGNPTTLNEKLQWMKFNYRFPLQTIVSDKYLVRDYVENKIGIEYLIPLYGNWLNFDDIDFDALPDQFVLKCNHDSGGLAICKDKKTFDQENAKKKINKSLKTSLITTTIQYGLQAFIIIFVKDYYLYVIVALSTQGLTNLITAFIASKMYPTYEPKGKLEKSELKEINRQIKDLFTAKFGGVILNSADTVVISAFLGLTVLAEYQNYYFILSSIMGLVTVLFNSCTAGIGNSIVVETREKNYADFKKLFFLIVWIAGWCTCCLLCIYQPFMKLWVGSDLMLPFSVVILLCIYYYIYEINQLLNVYKDAAGIWHKDRYRPLITALSNLVLNLLMVQFWGVYGIILSTIIATLFIGMPWLTHNLFTTLFDTSEMKKFIASMLSKTLIVILVCGVTYFASSILDFSDIGNLIYRGAVCCIISNLAFYVLLRKHQEYKECVNLIGKILH